VADQFLAEIRIFPFNFAPTGWAACDGQLMPIMQNTALFALLGTNYGGDGKTTFALPNLQGSAPMHADQGPGMSQRFLGEMGGTPAVTLLLSEIPFHNHNVMASSQPADYPLPGPEAVLGRMDENTPYHPDRPGPTVEMAFQSLSYTGGGLPHNNMMPYLTLNFCIAIQGIFPQRP
jgi:microcystin-dependent protein